MDGRLWWCCPLYNRFRRGAPWHYGASQLCFAYFVVHDLVNYL